MLLAAICIALCQHIMRRTSTKCTLHSLLEILKGATTPYYALKCSGLTARRFNSNFFDINFIFHVMFKFSSHHDTSMVSQSSSYSSATEKRWRVWKQKRWIYIVFKLIWARADCSPQSVEVELELIFRNWNLFANALLVGICTWRLSTSNQLHQSKAKLVRSSHCVWVHEYTE